MLQGTSKGKHRAWPLGTITSQVGSSHFQGACLAPRSEFRKSFLLEGLGGCRGGFYKDFGGVYKGLIQIFNGFAKGWLNEEYRRASIHQHFVAFDQKRGADNL